MVIMTLMLSLNQSVTLTHNVNVKKCSIFPLFLKPEVKLKIIRTLNRDLLINNSRCLVFK
jgi:hypothetical protein